MAWQWDFVCSVESHTEQGVFYDVKRRQHDGHLGCGCGSYRFAPKEDKTCKHLKALGAALLQTGGLTNYLAQPVQHETVVTLQKAASTETFTVRRRAISFGPLTPEALR